jgi:DNA-binding transcriptional MerR regulator
MKELSAAVALPKSTILHYLNEGLLFEPIKAETNMAYYHPDCVERIDQIKQLQRRFRLPLATIRVLLQKQAPGVDVMSLAEFQEVVFGPADRPLLDVAEFCRSTGLSPAEVAEEIGAGVLAPLQAGKFDADDAAIGRTRCEARRVGIAPADVTYYRRLAEELVDQEMALRDRVVANLPPNENAAVTMKMTQSAQAMRAYAFQRAFQRRIIGFQNAGRARGGKRGKKERPS